MIKRTFWENVAQNWTKKEIIEIPDILADDGIVDEFLPDEDESAELDGWLKDLLEPEDDLLDLTDLWG